MNLILDIGNSYSKISVFENGQMLSFQKCPGNESKVIIDIINNLINKFLSLKNTIVSSVIPIDKNLELFLMKCFYLYINVDNTLKLPIINLYKSPETLGKDRIAAVVAANNIFPGFNVLVFDAGTALTIDFINKKGEYLGGNISLGLQTRFKALNYYTAKLPLIENFDVNFSEIGHDTQSAIISGVLNGIIFEIRAYITNYKEKYSDLKIIFTGGDTFFFEKILKNDIFADQYLVLKGLNRILEYNAEKHF